MRHRGFRPEDNVPFWRRPNSDGSPERTRTLIFLEVVHLRFAFHLSNPATRHPDRALSAMPILVSDLRSQVLFPLRVCAAFFDFYLDSSSFSVSSPPLSYTL